MKAMLIKWLVVRATSVTAVTFCLVGISCTGCGTIFTRAVPIGWSDGVNTDPWPRFYRATMLDCGLLGGHPPETIGMRVRQSVVGGVDLPVSLCTDTLLIPLDARRFR